MLTYVPLSWCVTLGLLQDSDCTASVYSLKGEFRVYLFQALLQEKIELVNERNRRKINLPAPERCIIPRFLAQNKGNRPIWAKKGTAIMKTYEVIKEEYVPCTGDLLPDRREILELQLENPAMYVQDLYRRERSVEFLATEQNGSPVIEALLEGGRKYRYIFSEV